MKQKLSNGSVRDWSRFPALWERTWLYNKRWAVDAPLTVDDYYKLTADGYEAAMEAGYRYQHLFELYKASPLLCERRFAESLINVDLSSPAVQHRAWKIPPPQGVPDLFRKGRGRPKETGFKKYDEAVMPEMKRLVEDEGLTRWQAANRLADAVPGASQNAKAKRLLACWNGRTRRADLS